MFKMFLSKALGAIRIVLIPAAVASTACFAGTLSSAPKQADNHQMAAGRPPAVSTDTKLAAGRPPAVSTSAAAANV